MKLKNKILVLSLFLVLICCLGAVSATEDINETMTTDYSIDEVNTAPIEDVATVEDTSEEILSDEPDNVIENQNINENGAGVRSTSVSVSSWTYLEYYCERTTNDYIITLSGTTYTIGNEISFGNSATIIGTDNSYITGGTTSKTPFINTNSALTLHFINVKFLNVNAKNLLELDGTVYLENCTFNNIQTATGHNSVIYNTNNLMYLTGCNITNCNTGYGAVTNYNSGSTTSVVMYVDDCKFINNSASVEPGAINNCGILYVNNSEFDGNHANLWAGAIHTHTNAQTEIENTIFKRNTAGWNGGALFTYSKLKIKNCTFEDNNCTTNNGGGAIGAYNYGSGYNITICSSRFNYNTNLCYAYTNISTTSVGRGGAISVLNGGYLTVCNCNFTGNYAKIGQAIAAATYTYENGTGGNPHIKICNNRFVNHTATGIDTVVITGNDYIFNNNVFINSYQSTNYAISNNQNSIAILSNRYSESDEKLGVSLNELLSEKVVILYVNGSMLQDEEKLPDGSSWETAVGAPFSIYIAPGLIIDNGGTEGIIYIAKGDYSDNFNLNSDINITFVGYDEDTILPDISTPVYGSGAMNVTYTFINLTFTKLNLEISANFINCTFINPNFNIMKDLNEADQRHVEEYGYAKTYFMNFDNCVFKDVNTDNALITLYKYGAVNFNNCTFENILADSLVYRNATTYFEEDGISFKNCTFTNCKYNGVVDSAANFDEVIAIEDCNYDTEVAVGTTEVNGHFYVNATKLKVVAVETNISISSSEKGIVNITVKDAEGNPVANVDVKYNNGGENTTKTTNDEGIVTVTDLTGEGEIKAYFEGNENYLKSEGSYKYNFTETTPTTDTNSSTNGTSGNGTSTNSTGNATSGNGTSTTPAKTTTTTTKVTKKATKITAKKATFKAKKKTKKYTIVLKAGKKAVKKVKVTLKVGKKTYKATTNSKGKATFKITKLNKKGKYTAVIKFKGNKNFKATSKKVKITVKK